MPPVRQSNPPYKNELIMTRMKKLFPEFVPSQILTYPYANGCQRLIKTVDKLILPADFKPAPHQDL